jgi:uncharacterized integral membrane protein (TIGR00698 family)
MQSGTLKKALLLLLLTATALPWTSAPMGLAAGICFALLLGNPWGASVSRWSKRLLQASVTGLGFGISLSTIWTTGRHAAVYTAVGIAATMTVGLLLGRLARTPSRTSTLISFGTAICGGSAIAAMAPVIRSDDDETAVALATVFTLNSIGLLLFPVIGHLLALSEHGFGVWSALAIHDTSSVVGAAAAYGSTALVIATTVKLTRAVWIVPCAVGAGWLLRSKGKAKFPLFIAGFVAAATLRTLFPSGNAVWHLLSAVAKQSLVVTLFLIGLGLTKDVLRKNGPRPLMQGVLLWLAVSVGTLSAIEAGWIW